MLTSQGVFIDTHEQQIYKQDIRMHTPGGRLNIKKSSYQDRDPHVKDKMASASWPSYI